ncbi:ADP-ribosylation factor-like protein 6-interacting protein 6 [Esox lucius]|uniref:ADP-ribosylation factor-like protein 6-interacting protein 6 n=1 Tax=Esox lucius TaxID=8010 RepID=C1BYZ5_ESOLU|nr:ADP-ribosylation factor-like protein 6-interacting protein 6 [Esox lucius]ACO14248.1 ADP-ribosylation factor-like protein 6-interacting protein 6 [Esox lucius]
MDIIHQQRRVEPNKRFWTNKGLWPARILSVLGSVAVVSIFGFLCAFLYLILEELRTERVIQKDGSEVRLLGFWSILVMSLTAGICCCAFTWTMTYFDSFEPGTFPPTPLSPGHLRRGSGHSFHAGYSVAVLNGIAAAVTVVWSLT